MPRELLRFSRHHRSVFLWLIDDSPQNALLVLDIKTCIYKIIWSPFQQEKELLKAEQDSYDVPCDDP